MPAMTGIFDNETGAVDRARAFLSPQTPVTSAA